MPEQYRGGVVRTPALRPGKTRGRRVPAARSRPALTDIATTRLILANLDRLDDPDAHAATVIVSRIGQGQDDRRERRTGDLDWLALIMPPLARAEWLDGRVFSPDTSNVVSVVWSCAICSSTPRSRASTAATSSSRSPASPT